MLYEYTVNIEDFKAAQRLLQRSNRRASFIFWHRVMPCVGAICLILLVRDMVFRHFSYPAWTAALLGGLSFLGLSSILYWPIQIQNLYQAMKNGRADDQPLQVEIAGEEFISRVPERSEGRFRRPGVRDYYEDARVAILLVSKNAFLLLPKRTLPESAFIEIRAWMDSAKEAKPDNSTANPPD